MRDAVERARRVRLMLFDVDGVLTDGRLWYGPAGEEWKVFSVLDGHGLKMLGESGVRVAFLSARRSAAVAARAAELGVLEVLQGVQDKRAAFEALLAKLAVPAAEAGYMADDVVDLPVLRRCGFACAPREAHELVRARAHFIAGAPAGAGAAREVCEFVMRARGTLQAMLERYLA